MLKLSLEEVKKITELSPYNGGHDALKGLNKKGRIKYFKNHFNPIILCKRKDFN